MSKTIIEVNGELRNVNGWRPGPQGIAKLKVARPPLVPLPEVFSLRPFIYPIFDQAQWSTCTANAWAGAHRAAGRIAIFAASFGPGWQGCLSNGNLPPVAGTAPLEDPSRLFIYYNTEDSEGDPGEDNGATITDTCDSATRFGCCHESTWDYIQPNFLVRPSVIAYAEAAAFADMNRWAVTQSIDQIKAELFQGRPINFGCQLRKSFETIAADGIYTPSGSVIGGHAQYIIGWNDYTRLVPVVNSWNETWADGGIEYYSYDDLVSSMCSDFVAIGA